MKVFITQTLPKIGMQLLESEKDIELIEPQTDNDSSDQWWRNCQKADVILNVGTNQFDREFFEKCPNVKAISLFSVGFDSVDIEEANRRGIPVGNTPGVLSDATSDIAFLLLQMVSRRAGYNMDKIKTGGIEDFGALKDLGQELYGKTLGVYGLGRIGYKMAEKCQKAFGMKIIYHNRSHSELAEKDLNATYVSFDELVETADVVSVHASFSEDQKGLFNKKVFAQMKENAIFINTARGGFHNEKDLYEALKAGNIWGAGLDVTDPEPMHKDNPLLGLSTVCVLPHIGSATVTARNGMAKLAAENSIAFSKGEKMPHCANPEVYKK